MNVVEFLDEKNVEFDVIPHKDTFNAQQMAETLHVSGHEVAKTVLLRSPDENACVVAVLPADAHVDFGRCVALRKVRD